MEGEKKRELAALREAGLAKDPNWKPWRDPVFTERLYREDYAPGSAGQNGAHTPGKWTVKRGSGDPDVFSSGGDYVAAVYGCDTDEAEANARLIAAAPHLLEALQELQQHWHHMIGLSSPPEFHRLNDKLVSAIAAATGEEG